MNDNLSKRDKIMYILGVSAISFEPKYFEDKTYKEIIDDLKAEFEGKLGLAGEEIHEAVFDLNDSLFPEEFLNRLIEEMNKSLKLNDIIKIQRSTLNNPQEIETTNE